eukprot:CAMPEP_0174324228 /NCGR_PEP_ID=MMETSP0810-20121108/12352_1 /TAXON_ID=73025 ORGANISM="Eutreptiella gymnastica-like, Strain CCMP1594" /NCGR_SAMPLE_ID=MMETSP0810 /ASSEMBLY_ACC=CAM_ASM_000659 /LENGTH=433 /DNA_ID=CAMNT_0015436955 /DNA_START=33 /DNA_END=1329 /DNA_ORIENTATION=+
MSEGRSLLASSQPNDTALRRSCGAVVAVVALVGTAVTLLSTGLSPTDTHLFAAQGQATPATRHIQTAPRVANPLGLMPRPKAAAEAPTGSISESRRPQAIAPALGTPHVTGFAQRVLVLGSALLAVPLMIMGMRLQRRTRQSLWADLAIDDLGAVDRRFAMAAVVAEAEDCGCDDGGGQRHDQRDGGDEHAAPVAGADGRGRAAHVSGGGGGRRGQGRGRVPAAPRVTFLLGPCGRVAQGPAVSAGGKHQGAHVHFGGHRREPQQLPGAEPGRPPRTGLRGGLRELRRVQGRGLQEHLRGAARAHRGAQNGVGQVVAVPEQHQAAGPRGRPLDRVRAPPGGHVCPERRGCGLQLVRQCPRGPPGPTDCVEGVPGLRAPAAVMDVVVGHRLWVPGHCGAHSHVRVMSLVGCVACDPGMALPKRAKLQSNPIQSP